MLFGLRCHAGLVSIVTLIVCTVGGAPVALAGGPSSSEPSYLTPIAPGVRADALFSVGDSIAGVARYYMVGLPDGLGARSNGDGTFSLLVSHSLGSTQGIIRTHGRAGAFVSRWRIDSTTLEMRDGEDHITRTLAYDSGAGLWSTVPTALNRLGSGDMAPAGGFFNSVTGRGTSALLYLSGETGSGEGRAYAHVESTAERGWSYQLARLGRARWENHLVAADTGDATVIVSPNSSIGGPLYVYLGVKTSTGNAVERAGLNNGVLYGVRVTGLPAEIPADGLGGPSSRPFTLAPLGDVSGFSGAALESASLAALVTSFSLPEDGAWDPDRPNDFYFVTSGSGPAPSRLWRLRFADRANPALGGTLDLLLVGSEGHFRLEGVAADGRGHLLLQEDPGADPRLAKIWLYDLRTGRLTEVARASADRFSIFGSSTLTTDEESCGIIDASAVIAPGWFLASFQAHYTFPDDPFNPLGFVEGGQLITLYVPQSFRTGDLNCDGVVDFSDIDPFVTALASAALYAATYPDCARSLADTSGDGIVNFNDINDFVRVLIGG